MICDYCGEENCTKRACQEADEALADYYEAEAYPAGEEGNPHSGRRP